MTEDHIAALYDRIHAVDINVAKVLEQNDFQSKQLAELSSTMQSFRASCEGRHSKLNHTISDIRVKQGIANGSKKTEERFWDKTWVKIMAIVTLSPVIFILLEMLFKGK